MAWSASFSRKAAFYEELIRLADQIHHFFHVGRDVGGICNIPDFLLRLEMIVSRSIKSLNV
ncbi:MAG: hypothetical protein R2875_03600 [Desulfobacterales bacterium]